jgi:hypothetical protein
MNPIKHSITAEIDYESIPLPAKIIIPIEAGKFALFSFRQHDSDPLRVQDLKFSYAGSNSINISMRGTGRLSMKNLPDLKFGGTFLEIQASLSIQNKKLYIEKPTITRLDMPQLPGSLQKLLRHIVNKFLPKLLSEIIELNIEPNLRVAANGLHLKFDITVSSAVTPEGDVMPKSAKRRLKWKRV